MKFKRLFIVLLISFMLLSVPCVYASDSNTDGTVSNPPKTVKLNEVAKHALASVDDIIHIFSCTHKGVNNYYESLTKQISAVEEKVNLIDNILQSSRETCINKDFWNSASEKINKAKGNLEEAKSYQSMIINESDNNRHVDLQNKKAFIKGLNCVKIAITNLRSARDDMKNIEMEHVVVVAGVS